MNASKTFFVFILSAVVLISGCVEKESITHLPNIVYLLADDMGMGDLTCYNPDSKIPTPAMDALANEECCSLMRIPVQQFVHPHVTAF